jgi:hypothetical protein
MVAVYNDGGAFLWDTDWITVHENPRPGIEYAAPGGVERTDVAADDGFAAGYVGMSAEDGATHGVRAACEAFDAEQERLASLG